MTGHTDSIASFYGGTSLHVSQLTVKYPDDIDALFAFDSFGGAIPCWYKQLPGVNVPPLEAGRQ